MAGFIKGLQRVLQTRRGAGAALATLVLSAAALVAAGGSAGASAPSTKALWKHVNGTPPPARTGAKALLRPQQFRSFRLDRGGMAAALQAAPRERTKAARVAPLVVSLPKPGGGYQAFAVHRSAIMAPTADVT